ncbi:hypothetical protein O3G_MSEX002368 [Manduca sexta]|uniref:Peptidase S1 domain-containing protein n=1 Tax=Manduca sexta TaxID=7130 RepID=A0A921YPT1_MANSE|nr:hypothetical protein O3G_MSEX002368 [Manduca sexta]
MKSKIINNPKNVKDNKMRPGATQAKINKMINSQDKIIFGEYKRHDNNKFVWPSDDRSNKNKYNQAASTQNFNRNYQTTVKKTTASTTQDTVGIKFPERDTFFIPEPKKTVATTIINTQTTAPNHESTSEVTTNTDIIFFDSKNRNEEQSKNICTYIKEQECIKLDGFIYTVEFGKSLNVGPKNPTLVCCVLPLPIKDNSKNTDNKDQGIVFFREKIRSKRSNEELKQRKVLLKRRRPQEKTKTVPTEIVNEDEDPYWNIKNTFKPTTKPIKTTDYDYKDDSIEEYTDELPRPGLLGIYSEKRKPTGWSVTKREQTYGGGTEYDDVDDPGTPFGYGTIDPRKDNRNTKKGRKPIKLVTEKEKYNPENQIINFQSNPNFEVFQGFKLLNLVRNKNKVPERTIEKSGESNDSDVQESNIRFVKSSENTDNYKQETQLFGDCEKTGRKLKQKDAQIGGAEEGSHPWLVVVTPADDQNDILCYGTLVHPRAAITAADCVSEVSPKGIIVLAGLWKLNEKTNAKKRTPQVHLHPKFKPGSIANNLATLTWSRPFRLCDEVQTACVAELRQGKDCMLYGWGGFDQALRLRSRWQRAQLHECDEMSSVSKSALPKNAFCGTVQSRGTVVSLLYICFC